MIIFGTFEPDSLVEIKLRNHTKIYLNVCLFVGFLSAHVNVWRSVVSSYYCFYLYNYKNIKVQLTQKVTS